MTHLNSFISLFDFNRRCFSLPFFTICELSSVASQSEKQCHTMLLTEHPYSHQLPVQWSNSTLASLWAGKPLFITMETRRKW